MRMKEALRKFSFSSQNKDTPVQTFESPSLMSNDVKDITVKQHRSLSRSDTTPIAPLSPARKISYEDIILIRKNSQSRKSENVIEYLGLESKGVKLSALLAENEKLVSSGQSSNRKISRDTTHRKTSLQEIISKQSSKKARRRKLCTSYEPNKLLEKAIEEDYADIVKVLLESGQVNINKLNPHGYAPLHLAAYEDKHDIIRIMLDHGAFIDIVDSTGLTPLEIAVNEGCFECAHILIENGADQAIIRDGHGNVKRKSSKVDFR